MGVDIMVDEIFPKLKTDVKLSRATDEIFQRSKSLVISEMPQGFQKSKFEGKLLCRKNIGEGKTKK